MHAAIFQSALGISDPRFVKAVDFDVNQKVLTIQINFSRMVRKLPLDSTFKNVVSDSVAHVTDANDGDFYAEIERLLKDHQVFDSRKTSRGFNLND